MQRFNNERGSITLSAESSHARPAAMIDEVLSEVSSDGMDSSFS
jgi:hypothetical protein